MKAEQLGDNRPQTGIGRVKSDLSMSNDPQVKHGGHGGRTTLGVTEDAKDYK